MSLKIEIKKYKSFRKQSRLNEFTAQTQAESAQTQSESAQIQAKYSKIFIFNIFDLNLI